MTQGYVRKSKLEQFYSLSPLLKISLFVGACLFLILLGYFIDNRFQLNQIKKLQNKERLLKKDLEGKMKEYKELKFIAKQAAVMQKQFDVILQKLPKKTNIDEVLKEITKIGITEKLNFVYFKPQKEEQHNFYAVTPIKIAVLGEYHQMAKFLSNVAHIKQLVVIDNLSIRRENHQQNALSMRLNAKVYRYLDNPKITATRAEKNENAL